MAYFQKVSRFKDVEFNLPIRKTARSAGYDMEVAEDIIIPPYHNHITTMVGRFAEDPGYIPEVMELDELAALTKATGAKPTLVSTGVKCYLEDDEFLQLSVRSSSPLKYWLVLANGVGRL